MKTIDLFEPYIDSSYKDFSKKLSKTDKLERLGIRIPIIDSISKKIENPDEIEIIYHEDVILKGFAIGNSKRPFKEKLDMLSSLFPYISSWDQTDTISSRFKVTKKDIKLAYNYFTSNLNSREIYTRRFSIVWLMQNRKLYESKELITLIKKSNIESERYIMLAVAWALSYFYLDNPEEREFIFDNLGAATKKETIKKIRESLRYKGEALPD